MSRKAKLEGNIHDVATRPQPTDPRSATAQQAARRHPIAPSIAPAHGQQHGAANTSPRPNQGQHQQRQQRSAHGAGHNQGLRTLEFLTTAAPPTTDPQRAIRRAARRRSSSSSALSLSSISWASWRFRRLPTQHHHRRVDISFSNASSAATKVNSAWKHYKLTVSGEDFSWTYQPESDEPIVDGEAAAHEIIGSNERCCGLRA